MRLVRIRPVTPMRAMATHVRRANRGMKAPISLPRSAGLMTCRLGSKARALTKVPPTQNVTPIRCNHSSTVFIPFPPIQVVNYNTFHSS